MPKLGDAWVTISTKDAGFQKGISGAKKGFDSLVQTFARGNSFMVSSSNIGFRAIHRLFSLLKHLAENTKDGKIAIEDMNQALGAFGDSVAKALTGGMDLAQVLEYMTAIFQALTKGTREWDMAGEGVLITLLQMQKYWGQIAGMSDDSIHKIQAKLDELNEHMKKENDELTKRDVDNAQKKIDKAKKEGAAKRAEFLKMEDVWKEVQRGMFERGGGFVGTGDQPPAARGGQGLAIPAGQLGGANNMNPSDRNLGNARSDLEAHGIVAEFVDRLQQSNDPADRKRAMELQEKQNEYLKAILDATKKNKGLGP